MRGDPPSVYLGPFLGHLSTPHARGSTFPVLSRLYHPPVYPACAGIHPKCALVEAGVSRLPRMRGDPPLSLERGRVARMSTPHARGSTRRRPGLKRRHAVYPACAGIHPIRQAAERLNISLPRMRGDPPLRCKQWNMSPASTPHARGSTVCPCRRTS